MKNMMEQPLWIKGEEILVAQIIHIADFRALLPRQRGM